MGLFDNVIGPAISTIGSLVGGQQQQEASEDMSREQMDFQERMSSTAHQREVSDLRAAGLNPILSAKLGGASSPTGSMGTAVDVIGNAARAGVSTAMQGAMQSSQIELMKSQASAADAAAMQSRAAALKTNADEYNVDVDTRTKEKLLEYLDQRQAEELRGIMSRSKLNEAELPGAEATSSIRGYEVSSARAKSVEGATQEAFRSTDLGRLLQQLGIGFRDVEPGGKIAAELALPSFLRRMMDDDTSTPSIPRRRLRSK